MVRLQRAFVATVVAAVGAVSLVKLLRMPATEFQTGLLLGDGARFDGPNERITDALQGRATLRTTVVVLGYACHHGRGEPSALLVSRLQRGMWAAQQLTADTVVFSGGREPRLPSHLPTEADIMATWFTANWNSTLRQVCGAGVCCNCVHCGEAIQRGCCCSRLDHSPATVC